MNLLGPVLCVLFMVLMVWWVEWSSDRAQKRFEEHCDRVLRKKK